MIKSRLSWLALPIVAAVGFGLVWFWFGDFDRDMPIHPVAGERTDLSGAALADDDDDDPSAQALGDDDDDDDRPQRIEVVDGVVTVALDAATQTLGGVQSKILAPADYIAEDLGWGRVINLDSLFALRADYVAHAYQARTVEAQLAYAETEYARLKALYEDDANIAMKQVMEAQASQTMLVAERDRLWSILNATRDRATQNWGKTIAEWALGSESEVWRKLARRSHVLVRATFPTVGSAARDSRGAEAAPAGRRDLVREAVFISEAVDSDPQLPGETYYYLVEADRLRTGMPIDIWIARTDKRREGTIVPESAVVWSLGQAWAYVKIDPERFARRPVTTRDRVGDGWFVEAGLAPGEAIVVDGAQTLFAEEFRWQIQDEDAD